MDTYMRKEIFEQPEKIRLCREINAKSCGAAADEVVLKGIEAAISAARGTSNHAGFFGKYIFESYLGMPFASAAPSTVTLYGSELKLKNFLTVAISQSGAAADALEILRCAVRQGGVNMSITNNPDSALAKEAAHHLFCAADKELSVAATKTFSTEAYLLLMLAANIAEKRGYPSAEMLSNALNNIPGLMDKALEGEPCVKACAEELKDLKSCFVLARGICYPLVMEAALKMQETCYVQAKAFPISDFHHGPFAMVDEDTTVVIYGASGESLKNAHEMADKLKTTGCTTVVFSNDDELLAKGTYAIKTPKCMSETEEFFVFTEYAQMFALNLSLAKGLNPDSPRGLNKITVTK